ncbi:MAG: extracellular solute-binding protein [Clostridia bacterium]|nr:extracellular solute-binding protein [Clostridia bacterium]
MKKLLCILLALCLCLPLFSCHGSNERKSFDIPKDFDETREYSITFWAKNENNETQRAVYEQAIADFEQIYPNIHVTIKHYTDYGAIYNDVITNIATDTTPNVCITYPDHVATYITGENVVVPLDDLFADEKYGLGGSEVKFDSPRGDEMISKFLDEGYQSGYYYSLPFMRSTEACYVNKTYVEALGYTLPETLTWDFVWEVSEAAMEKDADGNFALNGQKTLIPFIYKSTDNMMIQLLKQKGSGYSNQNGEIFIFNDDTAEILHEVYSHAKSRAFSTFKISSYPGNYLNRGQCIFAIDSTAGATWMGTSAPHLDVDVESLVDFELEVMAIPQYDVENPQMISQGPSLCIFNKEDESEVLASWLFAQFLLTDDVQMAYSMTEGYTPVTAKAQNCEEYRDYLSHAGEDNDAYYKVKIDATKLLMDNTDNSFVTPVFNGSTSLRDTAGELIESVVKSARRGETVDDAYIEELYSEMTALHHLNLDGTDFGGKVLLGEMPAASVVLISAICAVWLILALNMIVTKVKNNRKKSPRY